MASLNPRRESKFSTDLIQVLPDHILLDIVKPISYLDIEGLFTSNASIQSTFQEKMSRDSLTDLDVLHLKLDKHKQDREKYSYLLRLAYSSKNIVEEEIEALNNNENILFMTLNRDEEDTQVIIEALTNNGYKLLSDDFTMNLRYNDEGEYVGPYGHTFDQNFTTSTDNVPKPLFDYPQFSHYNKLIDKVDMRDYMDIQFEAEIPILIFGK